MLGKTHQIGGVAAGTLTSIALLNYTSFLNGNQLIYCIPLLIAARYGSLFPDIDHPNSKMGRKVPLLSSFFYKLFGHRGLTHTAFFMILTSLPFFLGSVYVPYEHIALKVVILMTGAGWFCGYISHLLLDALTPQGIPFLWPFYPKNISLARIPTGKYEMLVSLTIISFTLFLSYIMIV